jgi:hypothetical protein
MKLTSLNQRVALAIFAIIAVFATQFSAAPAKAGLAALLIRRRRA